MPLHSSGLGKALIADFDLDRLVHLFGDAPLKRFTKRTITALGALAKVCGHTRACGFAVDDEEGYEGRAVYRGAHS